MTKSDNAVPQFVFPERVLHKILRSALDKGAEIFHRHAAKWHAKRAKLCSTARSADRHGQYLGFLEIIEAKHEGLHVGNIGELHVTEAVRTLIDRTLGRAGKPLSRGALDNILSSARFFINYIGKRGLLKSLKHYATEEEWALLQRRRVCVEDKSFEGLTGLSAKKFIDEVIALNRAERRGKLSDNCRLGRHFALRAKETTHIDIHRDLRTRARKDYLYVRPEGAKSGRERWVPIETTVQRALVGELRRRYRPGQRIGALSANESPATTYRRLYRMLADVGFTRKARGATFHSLRHARLHEVYAERSGIPPAVKGGDPRTITRTRHEDAAMAASTVAGHGRTQIVGAYGMLAALSPHLVQALAIAATKRSAGAASDPG